MDSSDPPADGQRSADQAAAAAATATATAVSSSDQLDNLSNLLICNGSSWEDEALDQYENETEKSINEHLLVERDQSTQKLFQSFQTSACAVAQMFKDKTMPPQTPWQSFQNSAGAITVLYKDSLEACKVHYDIGVSTGQQRKVKELINWLKKKKRRNIRKDELISFLIGKQLPVAAASSNATPSMFAFALNPNNFSAAGASSFSSPFSNQNNNRRQALNRQQQQQQQQAAAAGTRPATSSAGSSAASQPSIITSSSSSSSSGAPGAATDANYSDLATFREALIMHNRSRAAPMPNHHHSHHTSSLHHHHHHQQQQHQNHSQQQQHHYRNVSQPPSSTSSTATVSAVNQAAAVQAPPPNCDDLDCFFCEQIATHIEHKRSASSLNSSSNAGSLNLDMESPTRKRGRFY